MVEIRTATADDLKAVPTIMARLKRMHPIWSKYGHLPTAIEYIRKSVADGDAYIVGDYLMIAGVGSAWVSIEPFFIVHLVLRLGREHGNPASSVADAAKVLAYAADCVGIKAGDDGFGTMVSVYREAGFVPEGRDFFMDMRSLP